MKPEKRWAAGMPKDLDSWIKLIYKSYRPLKVLLVFSFLIFIWIGSYDLATIGFAALPPMNSIWDLTAVLFSAAQVCLFVISVVIAALAIFGFNYFEGKIREAVEKETAARLANVEKEARGRSFAILGYLIGEDSVNEDFTAPTNEERLREAINYCGDAYNLLKGTNLPVEFLALNNLLGYSCALHDKARRGYLLECAERQREAAEVHGSENLLLTYARTILEFSLEPEKLTNACAMVEDIKSSSKLNEKQKREADYLSSLCKQRQVPR
jgi:hypothetical protein